MGEVLGSMTKRSWKAAPLNGPSGKLKIPCSRDQKALSRATLGGTGPSNIHPVLAAKALRQEAVSVASALAKVARPATDLLVLRCPGLRGRNPAWPHINYITTILNPVIPMVDDLKILCYLSMLYCDFS